MFSVRGRPGGNSSPEQFSSCVALRCGSENRLLRDQFASSMKKYFERAGAAKMSGVSGEERTASLTAFSRENVVMRIASVHAGPARIEIHRSPPLRMRR